MKRFISLVLFLSMCLCIPAFAIDEQDSSTVDAEVINGELLITVSSQEEYDEIVAQIEADNMRTQQLWEQALEESLLPENQSNPNSSIIPYTTYYVASASKSEFYGLVYANVTFELLYSKMTNVAGATVFNSVKSVSAYATSSQNTLTLLSKNYTFLDSGRTVGVNYAYRMKVYDSSDGTYNTYSKNHYVEFYVGSGTGRVVS